MVQLRASRAKRRRVLVRWLIVALLALLVLTVGPRLWVYANARDRVFTDIDDVPRERVALVLGAGIGPDGELSVLLKDRVDSAIELYKSGKVAKLLMSGDNRVSHYNEPERMRAYAVGRGVPARDIAADFAGRRTYDSLYRARHIFGLKSCVVVSQGFHLDRAVFIGGHLGVKASGYSADNAEHINLRAILREFAACGLTLGDVYIYQPKPVMGKRERI